MVGGETPMQMIELQRLEHNQAFEEASAVIRNQIRLHARPVASKPGWPLRRKLNRALLLY